MRRAPLSLRQRDQGRGRPRLAAELLEVGAERHARSRHIERAREPEHVRAIVRQSTVGVGQVVRIASERIGRGSGHGAELPTELSIRNGHPAGRQQPGGSRERVGAERLPAIRVALFQHCHETVVCRRKAVRVGQQEEAVRRGIGQQVHRQDLAVEQRACLLPVLAACVRPGDEVVAVLVDVGNRRRYSGTELAVDADRVFVGVRRPRVGIDADVALGIRRRTPDACTFPSLCRTPSSLLAPHQDVPG